MPATVGGNSGDWTAGTSIISWAEGSFPLVQGVTAESANGAPNTYSLQLNTNYFPNAVNCQGLNCQGWQQFIYESAGFAFIEYWLLSFDGTCPDGWMSASDPLFGHDCFQNTHDVFLPGEAVTNLADIAVTGVADTSDTIAVSVGNSVYLFSQPSVLALGTSNAWKGAEFNVFGDQGGDEAVFNTGSTIVVQLLTDTPPTTTAPSCFDTSYTGETNNLNLLLGSCCQMGGDPVPGLQFTETNAPGQGVPGCPIAPMSDSWTVVGHPFDGIVTGTDVDGTPLMSCRSPWNGDQVGKTRADWNFCDIGYGGGEFAQAPYETLIAGWGVDTNGAVPGTALPFGTDQAGGPTLYSCRGYLAGGGGYQVGKVRPGFSGCFVPYGGAERGIANYEVLTTSTPLVTQSVNSAPPPAGAIIGGYDSDGTPLYVCQAVVGGGFAPGKTRPDWTSCDVGYAGQENFVSSYNVLVPKFESAGTTWPAGTDSNGTGLGVCRASYNGSEQVGKRLSGGNCDFGFGGGEVSLGSGFQFLSL